MPKSILNIFKGCAGGAAPCHDSVKRHPQRTQTCNLESSIVRGAGSMPHAGGGSPFRCCASAACRLIEQYLLLEVVALSHREHRAHDRADAREHAKDRLVALPP